MKPIVYYLDRGAPEPIRSALLEGARWWNQAFEAAGYSNAFRVELMPEGADPDGLRYNVIQWVHRATRGWSYGAAVIDPRTGEIIKGHVTLGSLRVRQDYLIAEGLLAPYEQRQTRFAARCWRWRWRGFASLPRTKSATRWACSTIYSASTVDRSSVMDYPPPLVTLGADGIPDVSNAYATGIGEWDKVSIAFGYQDFAPGVDEHAELNKIISSALGARPALPDRSGCAPAGFLEQPGASCGIPAPTRSTN